MAEFQSIGSTTACIQLQTLFSSFSMSRHCHSSLWGWFIYWHLHVLVRCSIVAGTSDSFLTSGLNGMCNYLLILTEILMWDAQGRTQHCFESFAHAPEFRPLILHDNCHPYKFHITPFSFFLDINVNVSKKNDDLTCLPLTLQVIHPSNNSKEL
jgi:hypothetical protein